MKRIIITNNPLLKPLYGNLNKNKFTFSVLSEIACVEAINKNEFDLALISPLIYASINSKEDIKILPTKMLVLEDFTKTVAINIRQNKESLSKIFFHTSNEFIIVATKLVLCERFNIVPELTNNLEEADIIVNYGDRIENCLEVNLSEDWYDTFEVPLVMGFWVFKDDQEYILNYTIKKISEDIENLSFNTAISQMMIFVNEFTKSEIRPLIAMEKFLLCLAPFAPHIAEELWEILGHKDSIVKAEYPKFDENKIVKQNVEIVLQVNSKIRGKVVVANEASQEEVEKIAMQDENVQKYIEGKTVRKIIFVKNKIFNIIAN
jgi:hypothetical protein